MTDQYSAEIEAAYAERAALAQAQLRAAGDDYAADMVTPESFRDRDLDLDFREQDRALDEAFAVAEAQHHVQLADQDGWAR